MIRTDTAKLIKRYPGPNGHFEDEFYDLKKDPGETQNVINQSEYASQIQGLKEQLDTFFNQYEIEEYRGTHIADLPRHNGGEPWVLNPETMKP